MKDLEDGDNVDKEADCVVVSLVLMLYSTSADKPSPPEIIRARSVLRRPATDGGPLGFVEFAPAVEEVVTDDGGFEALAAPALLLPADAPFRLPLDPGGAA